MELHKCQINFAVFFCKARNFSSLSFYIIILLAINSNGGGIKTQRPTFPLFTVSDGGKTFVAVAPGKITFSSSFFALHSARKSTIFHLIAIVLSEWMNVCQPANSCFCWHWKKEEGSKNPIKIQIKTVKIIKYFM